MLEKDVNQLDMDYMILYSRYIISNESAFRKLVVGYVEDDALIKLVKLGQLNALQLYFKEISTSFKSSYC